MQKEKPVVQCSWCNGEGCFHCNHTGLINRGIHYCGIEPPNKEHLNWQLVFSNKIHSIFSRFGFDTEHDARNAERFTRYSIENTVNINESLH